MTIYHSESRYQLTTLIKKWLHQHENENFASNHIRILGYLLDRSNIDPHSLEKFIIDSYNANVSEVLRNKDWLKYSILKKEFPTNYEDLIGIWSEILNISDPFHNEYLSHNYTPNTGSRTDFEVADSNIIFPFVQIPSGWFYQGALDHNEAKDNERPAHKVNFLYPFKISATTVTQELYQYIMRINPSKSTGNKLPVENVRWIDAIRFCNKLSRVCGFDEVYNVLGNTVTIKQRKRGFRLPTEAEWEYSSRGRGYDLFAGTSNYSELHQFAFFNQPNYESAQEVGQLSPNSWGLYDMCGNVWEWVWDAIAYDTQELVNNFTSFPFNQEKKVARGGCFSTKTTEDLHTYSRKISNAKEAHKSIGFRIVIDTEE